MTALLYIRFGVCESHVTPVNLESVQQLKEAPRGCVAISDRNLRLCDPLAFPENVEGGVLSSYQLSFTTHILMCLSQSPHMMVNVSHVLISLSLIFGRVIGKCLPPSSSLIYGHNVETVVFGNVLSTAR